MPEDGCKVLYVIIRIGCLCCDTPSYVMGVSYDFKKAEEIVEICNRQDSSLKHHYEVFPVFDKPLLSPSIERLLLQDSSSST